MKRTLKDMIRAQREQGEAHKHYCEPGRHWWLVVFGEYVKPEPGDQRLSVHPHCPCGSTDGASYTCPEHMTPTKRSESARKLHGDRPGAKLVPAGRRAARRQRS